LEIDLEPSGEARVTRWLVRGRAVRLTEGNFADLFTDYVRHAQLWGAALDGLTSVMMRQALAGMALHASTRPRDESVGFTLNFREPPVNVFITGDAAASTVVGRFYTEGVQTAAASRLFVQSHRPGGEPRTSAIEVHGIDILEVLEQYYEQSEQSRARFFEYDDGHFLMVLATPGHDPEWLARLGREEARTLMDHDADLLEHRVFVFHCGCSPQKMLQAMRAIWVDDEDDLFQGDSGVEAFCPRCGRRWWIRQEDFREPDPGA